MGPASLTSLRAFHSGPSGVQPSPSTPAPAQHSRHSFNVAAPAFTPGRYISTTGLSPAHPLWQSSSSIAGQTRSDRGRIIAASAHRSPLRGMSTAAEDVAHAQDAADKVKEGRLVEFKAGSAGMAVLGLVLRPSPKNAQAWEIEDDTGTLFTVKERDIAYVLPGGTFTAAELTVISKKATSKEDQSLKDALVALAWELSDPGAYYSIPEMAELLFSTQEPAGCAAAHRLLQVDRTYFKQIGRQPPIYAARSENDVKSIQKAAEAAKLAEEAQALLISDIKAASALPREARPTQKQWLEGPYTAKFKNLEAFALGKSPPDGEKGRAQAMALLGAAGVARTPQGAVELLQMSGYLPAHVQLGLLSSGLTEEFNVELEAAAAALAAVPPPDPDATTRADLRQLYTVTIDDESTTEIDDGLSAEVLSDGSGAARVWIHIADPTRWVVPGDSLDKEARRRSKTLYLATGMIPMFPISLATGPFSLRQGEECCAFTVSCVVLPSGEVQGGSINVMPSTILPSVRLTYDVANEMLEECTADEEPALHALAAVAEARRRYRKAAGAVEITMPEPKMSVNDLNAEIPAVEMQVIDADESPSRLLVSELMILAGEICAKLGAHLNIALPYRGQADPILPSDEELDATPAGPCRMVLLRSAMTRSTITADSPQRHAGLGLDAYAQVTSPIRRYGDLLVHWQLKAALRGETPPMSVSQMSEILAELNDTTQRVSKLERDAQSYWIAYYFKGAVAANPKASWNATFLGWFKQEAGLARVLLDDLGLETLVKVARPASPGTHLKVQCTSADPLLGMYRLDEVMGGSDGEMSGRSSMTATA